MITQHLVGLLTICESLDSDSGKGIAHRLLALTEDFKTPENLRKHALRTYGRVCEPTKSSIDNLIRLLTRNDMKLSESLFTACLSFIGQCRRKVEFARRVYPRLGEFRDRLHSAWLKEVAGTSESIDLSGARDIRNAVIGIEDLMAQYGEFAERAQLNGAAAAE